MADELRDIRAGLAAALSGIPGVQASPYVMSSPTLPCIWVTRPTIQYHLAMRNGVEKWTVFVQALVGVPSDRGAQENLDRYLSDDGEFSVKAAIEADLTLGGVAQNLIVTDCSGYQEYGRPDGTTALGCDWKVDITMNGG